MKTEPTTTKAQGKKTMRKPLSVLILEAQSLNIELENKIETLEKRLATSDAAYKHTRGEKTELEAELEQLHLLLDALPNTPSRQSEGENSWDKKKLSAMARLAGFLASKL